MFRLQYQREKDIREEALHEKRLIKEYESQERMMRLKDRSDFIKSELEKNIRTPDEIKAVADLLFPNP